MVSILFKGTRDPLKVGELDHEQPAREKSGVSASVCPAVHGGDEKALFSLFPSARPPDYGVTPKVRI